MTDAEGWRLIGDSEFVTFGTYRRNGELVATPVWIARDGDELVVTTERNTGKVKRLRNDARVVMQPCSRMGKVEPGAPTVEAVGRVGAPADQDPTANAALARKYGWQFRAITGFERLLRRIQRRDGQRVILRLSPAA